MTPTQIRKTVLIEDFGNGLVRVEDRASGLASTWTRGGEQVGGPRPRCGEMRIRIAITTLVDSGARIGSFEI
jgi:hypothetical protein